MPEFVMFDFGDAVLHAVVLLGALGVIETIERANQVSGDAANALKRDGIVVVGDAHLFAFDVELGPLKVFARVHFLIACDVGAEFLLGDMLVVFVEVIDDEFNALVGFVLCCRQSLLLLGMD